jgi:large subunit ribosomal protein L25
MTTLKTTKRNPEVKAKKLRRDGFATGVLYGREMDENIPLQFSAVDASRFIKSHKEGSQVILDFGDTKTSAIVKNIDYDAMKRQVMALDFQALVAGEAISTTVPVKLENEGAVQGFVDQELTEIHYKADPAHLLEPIEIDLTKFHTGDALYVKDLGLEEKGAQLITPADSLIFHIADHAKNMEIAEDETAEEEAAEA